MAIELIVETPILKGEKGDKGDTGSFDYTYLEEIVDEHLDNRFSDVDANLDLKVDKEIGKSLVDDEYIEKLDKLETLDKTVVEKFNDKVEQKDFEDNLIQMEGQLQNYIDEQLVTAGSGDMLKSVYDTDSDGVVDIAQNANNADTVNNLTVETAVPPDAVFTDTTYETVTTEINGLMSSVDKIKLNGIENGANNTEIINNLTSTEIDKALSAAQGKNINDTITSVKEEVLNIQNNITELKKIKRTLLFQGAIKTGDITLTDNMYNYRFLYIKVSSGTTGFTYGGGMYTIIDPTLNNSNNKTQAFVGYEVPENDDPNTVITYSGQFVNKNETTLTVFSQIGNVTHKSGSNHTGGTKYYVREIFGIR
ncbi:hypothetical protein [Anaerofustis butyriciformans]|uniref:hypothetical protein n=1 Tax=Anaerofustis butyriciformans TaxID=3108533 RepID=UPI002E342354|nr:hypothetical protein [Anaerofustis sp. HA2171]